MKIKIDLELLIPLNFGIEMNDEQKTRTEMIVEEST